MCSLLGLVTKKVNSKNLFRVYSSETRVDWIEPPPSRKIVESEDERGVFSALESFIFRVFFEYNKVTTVRNWQLLVLVAKTSYSECFVHRTYSC